MKHFYIKNFRGSFQFKPKFFVVNKKDWFFQILLNLYLKVQSTLNLKQLHYNYQFWKEYERLSLKIDYMIKICMCLKMGNKSSLSMLTTLFICGPTK